LLIGGVYLYEPEGSVLKLGLQDKVSVDFQLKKLHPFSHLYTSENLVEKFPGRVFTIRSVLKPDAAQLRSVIPNMKAHLSVRNFPDTVAALRKRWKLQEGGNQYLFATTTYPTQEKIIIVCEKVEGK
jgi:hypothetical protein